MLLRTLAFISLLIVSFTINAEDSNQTSYREIANDLAKLKASIDRVSHAQANAIYPAQLKITAKKVKLFSGASENADVITQATKGKTYQIIDKASDWYAVALEKEVAGQTSAWVNASSAVPVSMILVSTKQTKSYADEIYEKILEEVNSFKEKYKDNPYVKVTGFSVNIGIPPSVSVDFEFKE